MSGFILFGLVGQSFKVLQASFKGRDPGNRHFSAPAPPVWLAALLFGLLPANADDAAWVSAPALSLEQALTEANQTNPQLLAARAVATDGRRRARGAVRLAAACLGDRPGRRSPLPDQPTRYTIPSDAGRRITS